MPLLNRLPKFAMIELVYCVRCATLENPGRLGKGIMRNTQDREGGPKLAHVWTSRVKNHGFVRQLTQLLVRLLVLVAEGFLALEENLF